MALGIVCSGQGTQSAHMLAGLDDSPAARAVIDSACAVMGMDVRRMVRDMDSALFDNANAQPLLCAVQAAIWAVVAPMLPQVRVFAGYSIGEMSAAHCAGSFDAETLIRLARRRAEEMDKACADPCSMAAVRGMPQARLRQFCDRRGVWIAIVNGPDRLVVGGRRADVAGLVQDVEAAGAAATPLEVRIASHTPLMQAAVAPFRQELANAAAPTVPVLAGIDGGPVFAAPRLIQVLGDQIAQPVRWDECMTGLAEMGCSAVLELGPGDGLARMIRELHPDIAARSASEFRDLAAAARWACGQAAS